MARQHKAVNSQGKFWGKSNPKDKRSVNQTIRARQSALLNKELKNG